MKAKPQNLTTAELRKLRTHQLKSRVNCVLVKFPANTDAKTEAHLRDEMVFTDRFSKACGEGIKPEAIIRHHVVKYLNSLVIYLHPSMF